MQTKTNIRTAAALILLIQIVTSFGVIALLNRMTDLYQQHIEQNLVALETAQQAKNLGHDGAWAAAFLGAVSFILVVLTLLYLRRHVINPIKEIYETTYDFEQGNLFRRCTTVGFSLELERIAQTLNNLLDEHQLQANQQTALTTSPLPSNQLERVALLKLIDRNPAPVLIFDTDGQLVATNTAANELDHSPAEDLISQATQAIAASPDLRPPGFQVTELQNQGWIVEITLDNNLSPCEAAHRSAGYLDTSPSTSKGV